MTIKLLDHEGKATEVDVGALENIGAMKICVLTGDEVLTVIHKDYSIEEFDSSGCRLRDWYAGEYDVYNATTGYNLLDNEKFKNRVSSYWYEDVFREEEEEEDS